MGACKIKDYDEIGSELAMEDKRIKIMELDKRELEKWIESIGYEPYRASQVRNWIFRRYVDSFFNMHNIPKRLRKFLNENAILHTSRLKERLISKDGTQKYIFMAEDGSLIESVLIPEKDHYTLCVSSQVGCSMGCIFCLTGKRGLKRDLSASEILDQIVQVKRDMKGPERLRNIVFMGMGEPLLNYSNLKQALKNILYQDGMNFSKRRVTVSTCGIIPKIKRLGKDFRVNLAVSLNAPDEEKRSYLMPINRRYPLRELIEACKIYPLQKGRRITFEYVLIKGINDEIEDAERLVQILSGIKAKVNLIPFNPFNGSSLRPPTPDRIERFQKYLIKNHLTALIRKSKGSDICAACGQLGRCFG